MTSENKDVASAIRTLKAEAAGLEALADSLNGDFTQAVETIVAMKDARRGRLIVTGMGKSGHVGRKIAATLASTGTPSYFVHPGEASHGDLGMVTSDDVVLALSNSGEAPELSDIIHYTRRFSIPLIAITSGADSTLGKHADMVLLLPPVGEACPNGLAPTTSTTMTMALGDALAVALLERMGLTAEQYKIFHPGGKLGQKLLKVSELMHGGDDMPRVRDSANMETALLALTEKNLGAIVVVDDAGALRGIITDGDLKRHMGPDLLQKPVTAIMTAGPKTIGMEALAAEALDIMLNHFKSPITCLVVMDDGKPAGLIRVQDCLQAGVA
ncbi:MAG: KpsF/GutQ family sugar-phosphate isomerase [Rhodospirillales bacterium]|nr:KpsF/GutQ family sugar-phosphate isomerase [Rhodospirillales bacterium]